MFSMTPGRQSLRSAHPRMKTLIAFLSIPLLVTNAADAPIKDGLILALDASEQMELRKISALPPARNRQPVERWLNGIGGSAAVQPAAQFRPVLHAGESDGFLRFDGKDDYLALSGPGRLSPAVTVFVLAAPRGNAGRYSALFATSEAGKNDFTHGLNVDLGPTPTKELSVVNVESAGATGFRDFLQPGRNSAADLAFEGFHVFTVRSRIGEKGNEVFLDGTRLGERTRLESNIGLEEIFIGARYCSNDPNQPPFAQGFFHGDIAAVLVYNRALSDPEREAVEQKLFARTAALNAFAGGSTGHSLQVVNDPPTVQMLAPGFTVYELPARLTNLTSIRYRHDGKLVALGYDGRLHLITDSDGDGLEDKSSVFWDKSSLRGPIGMVLLPKDDPRGDGAFVASKGKVSLILDKDRDGIGDEEVIVATGWKENFTNVDATGLAVHPTDGSIYFCLGVENFANAYLVDASSGKSAFKLSSDRSTIQRVSADFSKRETVATGVRFACALAFNRHGDLFATEQEGATWLPNGNPFDELLHIVPGRHYGFPPRHPRHLPGVIDEPAVMEYGPQHQSTVGMVFNEGVNGGPAFGATHWHGDALICGESRGKLYRTKLVKTSEGYIAQNHLFACLTLLTVDTCVTPKGDLLVACHTGPPDWGTGPAGAGKLFKIRYAAPELPQPVWAWAAAPDEFRIAFDKPLSVEDWTGVKDKVRIEAGRYVSAADRFETLLPPYQAVRDQLAAPRRWVDVHGLSVSADRRTMILRVPRQTEAVTYAVTLPKPPSWRRAGGIPQRDEIDVALTLHGIEATREADGEMSRTVLPHPSFDASRALTVGSADHETFLRPDAPKAGNLTLQGGIDTTNIFVPSTQPGSSLDWDPAADTFASKRMSVHGEFTAGATISIDAKASARFKPLELRTPDASVTNSLRFELDKLARPIALSRLAVPWTTDAKTKEDAALTRNDVRGNWLRGRRIFFGSGICFTCHTIRGEGMGFGPDLTNLVHRDRTSVLDDILHPSAKISPDQPGSTVRLRDGSIHNGAIRLLNDETVVLRLPAGAETAFSRKDVVAIEPMKESLMPSDFAQRLTKDQLEDLLAFLLINPLEPAPITRLNPGAPPAREIAEVAPFLPPPSAEKTTAKPLRILLSAGEKDHGLDEHNYPLWLQRWSILLGLAEGVKVATCMGFPTRDQMAAADVIIFYSRNAGWGREAAGILDEFQARGGGLVYLHWAMEGGAEALELAERIGLATSKSAYRHGEVELRFTQPDHPITRGFTSLRLLDETYWALRGDPRRVAVLADAVEDAAAQPQLWTMERQKGRVFGSIPGHYTWTFDDPLYRLLVLRGIAWVARDENTDRFAELITVGARLRR
jgi:putative heme-binding domain-containing protein